MSVYESMEDRYFTSSYGRVHYLVRQGASDKSLIFLHGLGANTLVWSRVVEYLPKELSLYLVDLLGHGKSDAPKIDYSVSMQANMLGELISAIKGKLYVVGHSYGGWVAAYYASKTKIDVLILEDTAGLKLYFDDIEKTGSAEDYRAKLLKNVLELNNNKEYVMRSIIYSNYRQEAIDEVALSNITARTLVIWGKNDHIIDAKYASYLASKIKGSKLLLTEDGHDSHFTLPEIFAKSVADFVSL